MLGIFTALFAFSPTLAVWAVMYYLDRHNRHQEALRHKDVKNWVTNAILDRSIGRK